MPFREKINYLREYDCCNKPQFCAFGDQAAFLFTVHLLNPNKTQHLFSSSLKEITHFCAGNSTMTFQHLTKLHKRAVCGKARCFLHFHCSFHHTAFLFPPTPCPHFLHFRFVLSLQNNGSVTGGKTSY